MASFSLVDLTDLFIEVTADLFDSVQDAHSSFAQFVIYGWLLDRLIRTIPIFLIACVINFLARKFLTARVRFSLWTLVLIRLLSPFRVDSQISAAQLFSSIQLPRFKIHEIVESPSSWLTDFLYAVWLLGTLIVLFRTIRDFFRLLNRWWHGTAYSNQTWNLSVDEARRVLGVHDHCATRMNHHLRLPTTIDVFSVGILLPERVAQLTAEQQQGIAFAMLAKVRHHDTWFNVLLTLTRFVHWWNPIFRWTERRWLIEQNLANDELAIAAFGIHHQIGYRQTLELLNNEFLKRRIESIIPTFEIAPDQRSIVIERIQHLGQPFDQPSRWLSQLSWIMVGFIGWIGLTDAPPVPRTFPPITLPAQTNWRSVVDVRPQASGSYSTETYSLSKFKLRNAKLYPTRSPEAAAQQDQLELYVFFSLFLNPSFKLGTPQPNPGDTVVGPQGITWRLTDDLLKLHASQSVHDRIAKIVQRMNLRGMEQIIVEIQHLEVPSELSLKDLLPEMGGEVLYANVGNSSPNASTALFFEGTLESFVKSVRSDQIATYVHSLTAVEAQNLVSRVQSARNSNFGFAPKVTLFNGQTATLTNGSERPFVRSYTKDNTAGFFANVDFITTGLSSQISVLIEGERILLRANISTPTVTDVETVELLQDSQELKLQFPRNHEFHFECDTSLTSGNSLLLAPLRRDDVGRIQLILITPRLLDLPENREMNLDDE